MLENLQKVENGDQTLASTELKLGENLDLEFTQSFRDNMARGVEVLGFRAKVTRKGIIVNF